MCTRENDSNVFCVHETWLSSYDTGKIRDSRHLHKPAFKLHKFPITFPLSLISYTQWRKKNAFFSNNCNFFLFSI